MRMTFAPFVLLPAMLLSALAIAVPQDGESSKPAQPSAAEPLPDIKDSPVAKFVGTWKGTATHFHPGQAEPTEVKVTEKAEWKLGESAVFIEGHGIIKDPETGEEKTVHDAIGVIRYDPKSHKLMFYGFKAGEPANESQLQVMGNDKLQWTMQPAPNAMVRFTVTITDDTWTEVGEFSRDGGVNYHPFMEMSLQRVE